MAKRQEYYEKCRLEYHVFTYEGYTFKLTDEFIEMSFRYSIEGLREFTTSWKIDRLENRRANIRHDLLDEMVFSLGMIEMLSYWKAACPRAVIIKDRRLIPSQIGWWKKLYYNGLGEFYYTNGIDESFDDFMHILCNGSAKESAVAPTMPSVPTARFGRKRPAVMIPVGGGKDSVVSIELLKDKADRFCYIINSREATDATVEIAGLEERTIRASRKLDSSLLELNEEGFLNGHTPFSAIVAFSSLIAAYINDLDFVALSNESSAGEATVIDQDINHQYSKSFEFESDLRAYERKYFGSGVYFFSILRPLSAIQVSRLFSKLKEYHGVFKSCNVGSKEDKWCGHCPKCLFVYIILSPYLTLEELDNIFSKRMLEDETLQNDFDKLCGFAPEKPFECVGSINEVNASLAEIIRRYEAEVIELPYLLKYYKEKGSLDYSEFGAYKYKFASQHALTPYFKDIVSKAINN